MKLWQLKKLSTNEALNEPQKLPENWGPIFGLPGVADRLGDLSWVNIEDTGWFEVGEVPDIVPLTPTPAELAWSRAKTLLQESDWSVLPDVPLTASQRTQWEAYRKSLREIRLQSGFPETINWPIKPE